MISHDGVISPLDASALASIERPVEGFLAALEALDFERAMTYFAPGAVYCETTSQSGGEGQDVGDFLEWVGATATAFRSEVYEQRKFGPVVVIERTDHWTIGEREFSVHTVGMFELERGKITSWSDSTSYDVEGTLTLQPPSAPTEREPQARVEALHAAEPAAEVSNSPASDATELATAESSSTLAVPTDATTDPERVAALESQVHEWRRRALIWRERTIAAQTLADSLRANVEDLRHLIRQLDANAPTDATPEIAPMRSTPATGSNDAAGPAPSWKLLLSKDFWRNFL